MPDNTIEIHGLERLQEAFEKFPKQVARNMSQASDQAANLVILRTKGLQRYPPSTEANAPPTPYYIRLKGMQVSPSKNLMNSERLGTQWYVKREGWTTRIGNRASYAQWVHGNETQAGAMAEKGWRKLYEVAREKIGQIQNVYSNWVAKTLRDLGL